MLLIDKYSPKELKQLTFHKDVIKKIKKISQDDSIPNTLFFGPPSSGKKTLVRAFLEMIFDKTVHNTKYVTYEITSGGANNETQIKQSNYHIEIEPNNNFDKYLVQDVVKAYAKSAPLKLFQTKKSFKLVLIHNIDCMSYYAQTSLRRTMEKYSGTCRFIMWCRSLSKIIDPLKSRALCIRVSAPSDEELLGELTKISLAEGIKLKLSDYSDIIKKSEGQIKLALWLLQFKKEDIPFITSYTEVIDKIADELIKGNMKCIANIRIYLYNIMITNINGTSIIKSIVDAFIEKSSFGFKDTVIEESKIKEIIMWGAFYEHRLMIGRREIYHLEAFVNKIFGILQNKLPVHKEKVKKVKTNIIKVI